MSAALIGVSVTLWPHHDPRDYEECAAIAERVINESASMIAGCGAKFAGRRKVGGGYTYYDFMQNRRFDIAGPNPSPEEQKQIDLEYVAYLAAERRNAIAAELAKKQSEEALLDLERAQQATDATSNVGPPMVITPRNLPPAGSKTVDRPKPPSCNNDSFSCGWSKLSAKIKDAFGSASGTRR